MVAHLYRYAIPFSSPIDFNGEVITTRKGLLLALQHQQTTAYGEIAPLPGFSQETLQQALAAIEAAMLTLANNPLAEISTGIPSVDFGIGCAQWQLTRQCAPRVRLKGHPLLAGDSKQIKSRVQADFPNGHHTLKLKVGRQEIEQDLKLIFELLAINPKLRFRLDANRRWSQEQAATILAALPLANIDYIEEPTPDLEANLKLVTQFHYPLALDETLQQPNYRYQPIEGVHTLVIKPSLIGSPLTIQNLVDQAQADGVKVVLSSAFETNIGLQAISELAEIVTPEEAPGIDTLSAFSQHLLSSQDGETEALMLNQLDCVWPK